MHQDRRCTLSQPSPLPPPVARLLHRRRSRGTTARTQVVDGRPSPAVTVRGPVACGAGAESVAQGPVVTWCGGGTGGAERAEQGAAGSGGAAPAVAGAAA